MDIRAVSVVSPEGIKLFGLRISNAALHASQSAIVIFHGAGLTPLAPLYVTLGMALAQNSDVFLVHTRASGFSNYDHGFSEPSGWAHHRVSEVTDDCILWIEWIATCEYVNTAYIGHSWGALLLLASVPPIRRHAPVVLLSPIPSIENLMLVHYGRQWKDLHRKYENNNQGAVSYIRTIRSAPLPFFSTSTFSDLSKCDWDLERLVSKWEGNILIVVGAREDKSLINNAQQAITTRTITTTFKVIKEADHFYLNETNLLANEILEWLDEAFLSSAYPDHNSK